MTLSSDYVHTLGLNEPRVQVINPRIENICNPRCIRVQLPRRRCAFAESTAACLIARLWTQDFRRIASSRSI